MTVQADLCLRELVADPARDYAWRMSIFSENIALLIDRAGGQNELADQLGVNQGTVSKWKGGTAPRKLDAVRKAAEYAGVSLDTLMTEPLGATPSRSVADANVQQFYLPVSLPSEERLTVMMRGLLVGVGLSSEADEHAGELARRLPSALAQVSGGLGFDGFGTSTNPAAPSPRLSKRGPGQQ